MKKSSILLSFLIFAGVIIIAAISSCKKTTDPCSGIVCLHNGACMTGTCNCPYFAEGKLCDTLVRQKFIAIYNGSFSSALAPGQSFPGTVIVTEGPDSLSEITMAISNTYVHDSVHAVTYKSGQILTPSQTVSNGNTASGTGLLNGSTLIDTLNTSAAGLFFFNGTKQ